MGKVVVVAERMSDTEGRFQPGEYMILTPPRHPSREQEICGYGIFNLMGIKRPGRYEIVCKRVGKKGRKK
jgi:hypothetical protein